jgi:rfaE bifunctional protein kinase chain/domain
MKTYQDILNAFSNLNALVIGDVMIDAYIYGNVKRISPEAPVPVVSVVRRENRLGGAANVALNIKSLGAKVILCSVIGDDPKGKELKDLLHKENISTGELIEDQHRITTTKFRIIGNNTQLIRIDDEIDTPLSTQTSEHFIHKIEQIINSQQIDVLLFQDYDKGLLDKNNIEKIINLAKQHHIPIAVDPKKRNFFAYQGVDLFKPNLKELNDSLNVQIHKDDQEEIIKQSSIAKTKLKAGIWLLTLSENGIYLNHSHTHLFSPTIVREVADVSGAGDTLISVAALCLALNIDPPEMAKLANIAGGLVCEEIGVVPISLNKLKNRIKQLNLS